MPYQLTVQRSPFLTNIKDSPAVIGNGTHDDTGAINAILSAMSTGGVVIFPGGFNYLISAPLRIKSNTTLIAHEATITLASGSSCNMLQNWGVQANRRIIDGVTNSTTTFTSATAAFVSGDVGATIRIYYQDGTYLNTTIASVTNSTTAVLAASATHSQTGLYAYIGAGRDTNIRVFGGSWIRSANNATGAQNGWDSNSLRFRHVDVLEIGQVAITNNSGNYEVNPGDCTHFYIHDVYTPYNVSDTVHCNGPLAYGSIQRIISDASSDDIVSLTGADFHNQGQWEADCLGNITDITIETVRALSNISGGSTRAVLLLAGQSSSNNPCLVDKIVVRDVDAQLTNYPVFVGPDPTDTYTQGGSWGRILIDRVVNQSPTTPPGAAVRVASPATVTDLEVRSVFDLGGTTYMWVENGATVTRLVIIGVANSFISLNGTVTTKDIIDSPATLPANQTFSGNNTFTGTVAINNNLTIYPQGGAGNSASVFLNNQQATPQVWEFFCDSNGNFGVYDFTQGAQVMKIDPGASANMFELANGTVYLRQTTRISAPVVLSSAFQAQRVSKTANYTANANGDYIIGCDPTNNTIAITLPNIGWAGQIFIVKDETGHAASHNITIQGSGGQTVDGGTVAISANYGVCRVYSTGSGWAVW